MGVSALALLELLPTGLLEDLAKQTKVDYKVHKLKGKIMFNLLLYGMLEEDRMSLRSLEDSFNNPKFKFFFDIPKEMTTHYNSLSDRLAGMEVGYFADIYEAVYQLFSRHYDREAALKYHIKRVDSTMVCEEARKLVSGMSVGCKKDGKKQIKISLSLCNMFPSSFELFTSQAALSEDVALPIELFKDVSKDKDNVIATFDRGVSARKVFAQLDEEKQRFVTRIKEKSVYQVIEETPYGPGFDYGNLSVLTDKKIRFKQCPEHTFRLIETINDKGKALLFLTNCWDLPIVSVIDTYRKRWDIEVFFRFLKQELNLSHLISMNENGIKIILYMTMIVAMLLLVYKKLNKYGYKTAKRRFRIELDSYITALIIEFCGGNSQLWIDTPQKPFG